MEYKEPVETGNSYRMDYLKGIEHITEARLQEKRRESLENAKSFAENSDLRRREFIEMLGWPLTEYEYSVPAVRKEFVVRDGAISVYRLTIEVFSGFSYYGILFVHEDGKKRPLVLSQHGGEGTPELCSSLEPNGSSNYNDMTQRILKYNVNVFAGQMLLWNPQKYDTGTDGLHRQEYDSRLKQCGGSITALEIYCLMKSLDYLCSCDFTDSDKIGMAGLSYGGFYTLFAQAVDLRIRASLSCAFFSDRSAYCWPDWTWFSSGLLMHDAETAMLVYPRKLFIAVGEKDPFFDIEYARREAERLKELSRAAYGTNDWYRFCVFDGYHEFVRDEQLLECMINSIKKSDLNHCQ